MRMSNMSAFHCRENVSHMVDFNQSLGNDPLKTTEKEGFQVTPICSDVSSSGRSRSKVTSR